MVNYSVVILAGGKSSRMGQDKALVPFLNATLLDFILSEIRSLGDEKIIISNNPQDYKRFELPVFPDVIKCIGALGGIYSALTYASNQYCLILACDMPFVNIPLIEYMAGLISDYDAVIPRLREEEFVEPFRGFYSKKCIASIEDQINKGKRKVNSFFDSVSIRFVYTEEIHKYDPKELSFFNVNTPKDLEKATILARKLIN